MGVVGIQKVVRQKLLYAKILIKKIDTKCGVFCEIIKIQVIARDVALCHVVDHSSRVVSY